MDSREFLRQWFDAHDLTKRQASLDIGRSHSYVQQYIERGVPRQLGEDDRKALARRLDIDEASLKDKPGTRPSLPAKRELQPATVDFSRKTPTPPGSRDLPALELFDFVRHLPEDRQRQALRMIKAAFAEDSAG